LESGEPDEEEAEEKLRRAGADALFEPTPWPATGWRRRFCGPHVFQFFDVAMFNPAADAVISGGDYLIVMREPGNLGSLESMIAAGAR